MACRASSGAVRIVSGVTFVFVRSKTQHRGGIRYERSPSLVPVSRTEERVACFHVGGCDGARSPSRVNMVCQNATVGIYNTTVSTIRRTVRRRREHPFHVHPVRVIVPSDTEATTDEAWSRVRVLCRYHRLVLEREASSWRRSGQVLFGADWRNSGRGAE